MDLLTSIERAYVDVTESCEHILSSGQVNNNRTGLVSCGGYLHALSLISALSGAAVTGTFSHMKPASAGNL